MVVSALEKKSEEGKEGWSWELLFLGGGLREASCNICCCPHSTRRGSFRLRFRFPPAF